MVNKIPFFKKSFYLTGGTALAAYYYNHRDSEDIDLFSDVDFSPEEVQREIQKTKDLLGWKLVTNRKGLGPNNYTIYWSNQDVLKVDFVYYAFKKLREREKYLETSIDSIYDIAANKLETILLRKKVRDYIDLYFILNKEKLDISTLRKLHQEKLEFKASSSEISKAFLQARELTDFPKMRSPFDKKEMFKFYENLAKSLEGEIFKK